VDGIKIRRLGWAGHIRRMEDERIPARILDGKFHSRSSVNTKNKNRGRCPEGCIADARNTGREDTNWDREERRCLLRQARAQKGL
jgi:hypothetical protein